MEAMLDDLLRAIGTGFTADPLALYGPLDFGLDDTVRKVIEGQKSQPSTSDQLVVLVDTDGGYLDVVNRIVDTIRYHYRLVSFVIPNAAYSAGTILAMSGDAIYMDYYSRLGPIDPQVPGDDGQMIPALGYLRRYEALIDKSKDPSGGLSMAEVQLLINGFNQAELYMYEQQRELSVKLLGDWLCNYKFKDWNATETRGEPVTAEKKRERATEIANALNDTERWHSHSNGISAEVLRDQLNLKIDEFGVHGDTIRRYHDLVSDYTQLNGHFGTVHAPGSYIPYHVH
jgi:hypothetical protein